MTIICQLSIHLFFFLRNLLIEREVVRARVLVLDTCCRRCAAFFFRLLEWLPPHLLLLFRQIFVNFYYSYPYFSLVQFFRMVTRCGLLCCCWEDYYVCVGVVLRGLLAVVAAGGG